VGEGCVLEEQNSDLRGEARTITPRAEQGVWEQDWCEQICMNGGSDRPNLAQCGECGLRTFSDDERLVLAKSIEASLLGCRAEVPATRPF
jgi:hypothetical protein